MDASLVVVGDEILAGHVQDANSHFIAARLSQHGHRLRRVVVVGDDPKDIGGEIARDLDGRSSLVFVCGGLGPTHDDRTMEGVAMALGTPLAPCPALAERIEEVVSRIDSEGFSASFGIEGLRKMALAPAGAEILPCSIGAIPAVTLVHERARIVILPGPPRELQAVFTEAVEPRYLEGTGEPLWKEELTHEFPESVLAEALTALAARFGGVSIGSYPQRGHVLIRVAGPSPHAQECAEALRETIRDLEASEEGARLLEFVRARRTSRNA